jgi:hypothetical protein
MAGADLASAASARFGVATPYTTHIIKMKSEAIVFRLINFNQSNYQAKIQMCIT